MIPTCRSMGAGAGATLLLGLVAPCTPAAAQCPAQTQRLTAPVPANADTFGVSVDVRGGFAIVGALGDKHAGPVSGAAHTFRFDQGWVHEAKIIADDAQPNDAFGRWVAIDGDVAVVGADGDDDKGDGAGAVYVYRRDAGGAWTQEAKLTASDGAALAGFGWSADIDGDWIVVGTPGDTATGVASLAGAVYIFEHTAQGWVEREKLLAPFPAFLDRFGESVAISGDRIIAGRQGDPNAGSGSALVFVRNGAAWTQEATLFPVGGTSGDMFARRVAIDDDIAVCGAEADESGFGFIGNAHVYRREFGGWSHVQRLAPAGPLQDEVFGRAVAVSGGTILVGSSFDSAGTETGSAHVFTTGGNTWTDQGPFVASGGSAGEVFSFSLAIDGGSAVVGGFHKSKAGAAYTFDLEGCANCYADCDASGLLDFFDFLCFQNAFALGQPYADCDQSGTLDFFDFLCFQNAFAAGCP